MACYHGRLCCLASEGARTGLILLGRLQMGSTVNPGAIRLGQAKKISSRAIEKATQGQCTRAEIQKQLDGMFEARDQVVVRAVKHAGKVKDDVRNVLMGRKD